MLVLKLSILLLTLNLLLIYTYFGLNILTTFDLTYMFPSFRCTITLVPLKTHLPTLLAPTRCLT